MRKLSQSGDTIIEVLIAVAIVGLMLTGAFAISNASLRQIRMAQERSEAQRIAQSAVEMLNSVAGPEGLTGASAPAPFCVLPTLAVPLAIDTACLEQNGRYDVSITRRAGTSEADRRTFIVTVTWEGLSGTRQELIVDYRVAEVKSI